jgi:hypothetical protein
VVSLWNCYSTKTSPIEFFRELSVCIPIRFMSKH